MVPFITYLYLHFLHVIIFFFRIFLEPFLHSFYSFATQKTECPFWNIIFLCIKSLVDFSLYLERNPTRTIKIFLPVSIILFQTTCALTKLEPPHPVLFSVPNLVFLLGTFARNPLSPTLCLEGFLFSLKFQFNYHLRFFLTMLSKVFSFVFL